MKNESDTSMRLDWVYEVVCEVMSRNVDLACHTFPPELRCERFPKGKAQEAADFARSWVAGFSDADIPDRLKRHYNGNDLPRAQVRRRKKESRPLMLAVWKVLDGTIKEERHEA